MCHTLAYSGFETFMVSYEETRPPDGPLGVEVVGIIKAQLAGDPTRGIRKMLCE